MSRRGVAADMEKGKKEPNKEPRPAEGASLLSQDVYGVCFPKRDSLEMLQGELASARQRFFTGGRKAVKVGRRETVKGFDGDLRGKLSRWGFYWKKTALGVSGQKGVALEEAFDQKGGYVLVSRDFQGVIVSRAFFSKDHAWQKSEYYEPWDPGTAKVMFKPDPMEDVVGRYDWDPDKKLYRSVMLHPAPYQPGSAEQALVNARFGEPALIVSAEAGPCCYCPQQEAQARVQALEEIRGGTMVLMPAWEIKEGAFSGDEEDGEDVTFPSLEEYARIEKKEKPAPPLTIQAAARDLPEPALEGLPMEAPPLPEGPPAQTDELDIEFILADARQEAPAEELPAVWDEAAPAPPLPPAQEVLPPVQVEEDSPILPVVREAMEQAAQEAAPPSPVPQEVAAPCSSEIPPVQNYGEEGPEPDPYGVGAYEPPYSPAPAAHAGYEEEPPKRAMDKAAQPQLGMEEASILSAARQAGGMEAAAGTRHDSGHPSRLGADDASILSAARQAGGMEAAAGTRHDSGHPSRLGADDASILSAARQAGGMEAAAGTRHGSGHPSRSGAEDTSILSAARQAGEMGRVQRPSAQRHAQKEPPRHTGPVPQPSPPPTAPGGQRLAPQAPLDAMRAGRLTGKGRAQQPSGLTAYEGDYQDGKRQGFGSHYYKNGDLSYAGFWRDDKKDGLGVSFREGDHALHVSRWVQGRPGQQVSLFDKEGSLRFGGRIVNGKKEGAGVSVNSADGSVMVTKWAGGQNTGLASAFDPEGNLLYYGSWKNGMRHGHGTEFDKNGAIVFDGEWRDDQYFNGILYQKPADDPQLADPGYTSPDWDL